MIDICALVVASTMITTLEGCIPLQVCKEMDRGNGLKSYCAQDFSQSCYKKLPMWYECKKPDGLFYMELYEPK